MRAAVGPEDRCTAAQMVAPAAASVYGADRAAGYRYDISILQAEFSLTQVLDRPVTGRAFFEEVIRENLDIGRPSQAQLIFERRVVPAHPGAVSYARHNRGGGSLAARGLQEFAHQAVPQARAGIAYRNHHQQHPRFRHRQALKQPTRTAQHRLSGQPASPGRPNRLPRLRHRRRRFEQVVRPIEVAGQRASACASAMRVCRHCSCVLVLFSVQPAGLPTETAQPCWPTAGPRPSTLPRRPNDL